MSTENSQISACRHCLHYQGEGRRGGTCLRLDVPVQASWRSCPLATPCFSAGFEAQDVMPALATVAPVRSLPMPATPMIAAIASAPTDDYSTPNVVPIRSAMRTKRVSSSTQMAQ